MVWFNIALKNAMSFQHKYSSDTYDAVVKHKRIYFKIYYYCYYYNLKKRTICSNDSKIIESKFCQNESRV